MIIFPAIDIKDGKCVRLVRGEFNTASKVAEDALATARSFKRDGAEWLHMVDLDGAKGGGGPNRSLILEVARSSGLKTEIGGGIRALADVEQCLAGGAKRVVLGSAALEKPELAAAAAREYGDRIAVGIDARDGFVSTHGWTETSKTAFTDFAKQMESAGIKTLIFTDISRDGTLSGPAFDRLAELQRAVGIDIVASGGVRDADNIRRLSSMGLYGAICGKSLYSGTLSLKDALNAAKEGGGTDAC
jgi:phosphoribosylformimino-5-aminoimidazole carboxamide ribotide isomerase